MIHKVFEELRLSGQLPSSSGVGLAILRQTSQDDLAFDDLVATIGVDPALTGRLLKLANAGASDTSGPALAIVQAAAQLGPRSVRNVALGFTLVSAHRSGLCSAFDYEGYWSASLACAVSAEVLGRWTRAADPAEAFTLGLLSRIGTLALACIHPETYAQVLRECRDKPSSQLSASETLAFDIDHNEVTAAMMAECRLPEAFQGAVLEHERLPGEPESEDAATRALATLLRAAWRTASACVADPALGAEERAGRWSDLARAWSDLGVPADEHDAVRDAVLAAWRARSAAFGRAAPQAETADLPLPDRVDGAEDGAAAEQTEVEAAQSRPLRILVVDDDAVMRRLLTRHLEVAGYEVLHSDNGQDALQVALSESPHIVVTDWIMPGMSGLDLCRALRRFEPGRRIYVLILTGREDEEQIVEGFQAGADDYVSKPFNPRVLLARVQAGQRMVELQQQADRDRRARSEMARDLGLKKRQLQGAVWTDFLTGLPNRRYAMERLEKEWRAAVRTGKPLSVVMVDVDHFKRINDTHGHDVGDVVLKESARVLRAVTRRGDVVCRLGGEEFLVINVNSGLSGALTLAERLRSGVEQNRVECAGFEGRVTVSLGVAELQAGMDVDALIKAADQAVYEAKAAGRNTIRSAAPGSGRARSA